MSTKSTSTRRFAVSSIASGSIVAAVIRQVQIFSDATYVTLLNETTVNNAGGYIQIVGIGFQPGCVVYYNNVLLSSTFISSTVVRATTPAVGNGSYVLLVANSLGTSNNASAIYVLSTSGFPTWTTTAYFSSSATVSVQLVATGDAPLTYSLQSGSSLPDGTTLSSSGLLSGTIIGATNGIVYSFVALVDDAELQTTQATITLTIAFSDPYYKNVTLLLNGETAVTPFIQDTSTNNYNLIINGDTKPIPFNPYQTNYYSNYFDGTGDWLTAPASAVNSLANGPFTVEAWIFMTGAQTQTYGHTIVGTYPGSGNGWVLHVNRSSGGPLGITWANGSPTGTVSITYNTYLDVGKWYHIAVVRTSTAASGLTIYLNGVSVATGTDATNDTVVQTLYVAGGNTVFGGGYITNVRIVKGVAVYTGAFTPPTSPLTATQSSGTNISAITGSQTSFLSCQSLSAIDNSVNSQTITKLGDTAITKFIPFSAPTSVTVNNVYSMFFDGTGDYLTTPSNAVFAFGTGDFTIEGWFYFTGTISTYQRPWGWSDANDNIEIFSSVLRFGGTNQGTLITGTTTILARVWYHIAVTRLSGVYKMWLNGVQEGGSATNSWNSSARQMGIGAYPTGVDPITGYISNLRVVKGIAVYTGTFTPSTTQLTSTQLANVNGNPSEAITGTATSLLTCQNSTLIDNSSNVLTLTPNADVRPINSITPFTQSTTTVGSLTTLGSAYCDGTGDYILSTLSPSITIGTSDFSMEAWGYWTTFNSSGTYGSPIISLSGATSQIMIRAIKTAAVSTTLNYYSYINSGGTFVPAAGYSSGISAGTLYINQWTHIAVSRQGSTWRMFINGVVVNTQTDATSFTGALVTLSLGIDTGGVGNGIINGYIEDARICVGTAAYINTFAPPVQPLTAITNTQLLTLQYNGGANNSGIIDNSPVNNIITRFGNTSQGTFSPFSQTGWSTFIGYGAYGYQSLPANTGYDVTGADFTVEFWANFSTWNTMGSSGMVVLGNFISTNGWYISWNGGVGGNLSFSTYNAGAGVASIVSTGITAGTNFQLGTWNHFTLMQKTSVIYFYLNGVMTYSTAAPAAVGVGQAMYIGVYAQNFSYAGNPYFYYSNLRIIKGTGIYSTAGFTPPTTPLTPIAGTTLLLGQSSNLVDNSGINATITNTVSGVAPSSQALSPFGSILPATPLSYSNYFDGTGDYLTLPSNQSQFTMGTGDFTVEMWVNINSLTTQRTLYDTLNSGDSTGTGRFGMQVTTGGVIQIYTLAGTVLTSGGTLVTNTWYHLAYSRSSASGKLFVNGVQVNSTYTDNNNYIVGNTSRPIIGINAFDNSSFPMLGSISNLRVVKGVAVYTGTFTPPTSPLTATQSAGVNIAAITGVQTSLLTCQSTTIIDNSTNAFTITVAGNTVPRIFNPFGYTTQTNSSYTPSVNGGSAYFDGTTDYLTIPRSSLLIPVASENFTIEAWAYLTRASGVTGQQIVGLHASGVSSDWILYVSSTYYPIFFIGATSTTMTSSIIIQPSTWNHIAVVRTNTNTVTLYVNGVAGATTTTTSTMVGIGSNPLSIGSDYNGVNFVCMGYIFGVSIVRNTARYLSNFIPPTAPLTPTQNTVLLNNMTSGGIIDYHSSNVLETVGNAQLNFAIKLFGNASMRFDGTGDYLFVPSTQFQNYAFNTGDFTIECWLYQVAFSADMVIAASFTTWATSVNFYFGTRAGSPNILIFRAGDSTPIVLNGNTGITTSTWTHVAVCRASGVTRMFVGGVAQTATHTGSVNVSATTQSMGIGAANNGSEPMNGYIDDLRITKGFARYTGNFNTSPPISPAAAFLTQ